ncbi:unnamed protein product [Gadus morhua 'NCC']
MCNNVTITATTKQQQHRANVYSRDKLLQHRDQPVVCPKGIPRELKLRRRGTRAGAMTPDTTDTDFITVASGNTEALLSEVGNHRDFGEFLHADFRLPIHCTSSDNPQVTRYTFDVDGVMIQWGAGHLRLEAFAYLKHIRDLRLRLVCQVGCRIKQVVRFEGEDVPFEFDPREFFDLPALQRLFQDRALLVPFQDREDGRGLLSTLRGVLALEELFFGHPLSSLDNTLSASLGTSERSATHEKGFIGLAPHNSASLEESPPPLHHWTRDPLQKTRIKRLWALCQCVEAGPAVLGAALIRVLLGDLYQRKDQLPCTSLKSDTPPGRLTGATDVKKLAADLTTKESFPVPHTFGRARTLVRDAGQDVEDCLVQGFPAEGIVFFPAFKFTDLQSTRRIWWNFKDWVQVSHGDQSVLQMSDVASKTPGQGKFTLDKVRNLRIWSLHPTVPYKLQKHGIAIPSLRPPPPSAEKECVHPLEDVQAVDDQEELRPPVVSAAMCLPANSGKR